MIRNMYVTAAILALGLIGLATLPDYVFFPLVGAASLIAGVIVVGNSPGWGACLIVVGIAMAALGVKCAIANRKEEDDEAEKAEQEVRRRFGRIREDD